MNSGANLFDKSYFLGVITSLVIGLLLQFWIFPSFQVVMGRLSLSKNRTAAKDYLQVKSFHDSDRQLLLHILHNVSIFSFCFALILFFSSNFDAMDIAWNYAHSYELTGLDSENSGLRSAYSRYVGFINVHFSEIRNVLKYTVNIALSYFLVVSTTKNTIIYLRLKNFTNYERSVKIKLGYLPDTNAAVKSTAPNVT